MVLRMASPYKHEKTGVWWFRRAVPERYREVLGKREIKRSLGTKDEKLATRQFFIVAAEVDAQFRAIETGPVTLTQMELVHLAGEYYREKVESERSEPGSSIDRANDLKWRTERKNSRLNLANGLPVSAWEYSRTAREFLRKRGHVLEADCFNKFLLMLRNADLQAREQLLKNANGDYSPDPKAARFPAAREVEESRKVSLWPLWEKHKKALAASTQKRWRGVMERVEARFGDDLAKVKFEGIVAWCDDRCKEKFRGKLIDPGTVSDVDLAALRWILERAVKGRVLAKNEAAGVEVVRREASNDREKGFTKPEAIKILSAAIGPHSRLMSPVNAAVRRWVPWICAYTGARVNEITQARHCDLRFEADVGCWVLRITPEAGSTKNNKFRDVPLHPHLIEQGFITYAETRRGKPLFYDEANNRNRSEENPYYKKQGERLAEWVRKSLKINDKRVKPNHGWRHRFKSVGRDQMDTDIVDAIQGHAPRREAQKYGDTWVKVAYREICKHPRYEVSPS